MTIKNISWVFMYFNPQILYYEENLNELSSGNFTVFASLVRRLQTITYIHVCYIKCHISTLAHVSRKPLVSANNTVWSKTMKFNTLLFSCL